MRRRARFLNLPSLTTRKGRRKPVATPESVSPVRTLSPAHIPQKWVPVLRSEYAPFIFDALSDSEPVSTSPENATDL
jgi:hypothetical protein